jgi:hypothetical protein
MKAMTGRMMKRDTIGPPCPQQQPQPMTPPSMTTITNNENCESNEGHKNDETMRVMRMTRERRTTAIGSTRSRTRTR